MDSFDATLDQMVTRQQEKLLRLARELAPGVTPEDIRNPQDFPQLVNDPLFNYEDGVLAGYLSIQMAWRAAQR